MTQRPIAPVSGWLLHLFVPMWLIALSAVSGSLMYPSAQLAAECPTGASVMLAGLYALMLIFNLLSICDFTRPGAARRYAGGAIAAFAAPALLGLYGHHAAYGPRGGAWQETVIPSIVMIWIGVSAVLLLSWTGIVRYGVRARWAVPISASVVLLTLEACLRHLDPILNGAIGLYAIPFILVGLFELFRAFASAPAPS